ncbi:MAG: DUF368 domain-containing protein [Pirellulaceae bacterium]|nr:DUF368 domain-containing protein [Pirellulaceae bacterium]
MDNQKGMASRSVLALRALFGGLLMGLANLVPGISGGTMLLAAGIYPNFIEALSDVTRFRFRFRSLLVLGCVVAAAGLGILMFAGSLKDLVLDHRWIMYSLFIGLTLGGLPVVWRLAKPATPGLWISAALAFALMVGLAVLQENEVVGAGGSGALLLFIAGMAGASAMILPGLSGGYLLLLLGQYVPILTAVDQFKEALKARDIALAMEPAFSVLLPVGIGVIAGVVVVGNLLSWLLKRFEKQTLGVLVGLLLGSVIGLWPFQQGLPPEVGEFAKNGEVITVESVSDIEKDDWKIERFAPSPTQVGGSLGLIILGFGITLGVAAIGQAKPEMSATDSTSEQGSPDR